MALLQIFIWFGRGASHRTRWFGFSWETPEKGLKGFSVFAPFIFVRVCYPDGKVTL